MSARGPFALLALLSIPLPACSAIVRELNVSCESDDDCDALNQAEKLEQSCITYQCRTDHKGCEKQPRDKDRDGVPDRRACADQGYGEKLDCDDDDDARAEGLKESCDGIDNDCDETIDEGALGPDSLRELESVSLGGVSSLAFAGADDQLLVLATRQELSLRRTTLLRWPRNSIETLQDPEQSNCQGQLAKCALDPLAVAVTPTLLVALGIEATGVRRGTPRLGVRKDWSGDWTGSLLWDASDATPSASNLRDGLDPSRSCSTSPAAREPRVALRARGEAGAEGLAVWRQGPGASALFGIGFEVDAAGRRVEGVSGPCSAPLGDAEQLGQDPPSMQAWTGARPGYFVAYDSARGVELARVGSLSGGAAPAFSGADAAWLDEPNARHVALASSTDGSALGLAWRVPASGGWQVRFAEQALKGSDAQFGVQPEPFDVSGNVDLLEGPHLAHIPQGVLQDPQGAQGWLVLWVEAAGGIQRLMGVRIAKAGENSAELPFALLEAPSIQHAFAYARSDRPPGYGFVTANDGGQLNIGSLECRAEP
jgi:hypothetical protein